MVVEATAISKPIMQLICRCISYYDRNKLKGVTVGVMKGILLKQNV